VIAAQLLSAETLEIGWAIYLPIVAWANWRIA